MTPTSSEFVLEVLKTAREAWEQSHALKIAGIDLAEAKRHVSRLFEMTPEDLLVPDKHPKCVRARSVLCYFLVRKLGMTTTAVAKELGISQPAVSIAAARGGAIVRDRGLRLPEGRIL